MFRFAKSKIDEYVEGFSGFSTENSDLLHAIRKGIVSFKHIFCWFKKIILVFVDYKFAFYVFKLLKLIFLVVFN